MMALFLQIMSCLRWMSKKFIHSVNTDITELNKQSFAEGTSSKNETKTEFFRMK